MQPTPPSPEPRRPGTAFDQQLPITVLLIIVDVALLVLALYFVQEGEAQRSSAEGVKFFVEFPAGLLPLAYAAAALLVPNFAVIAFSLMRNLYRRRWPWATTFVAAVLLAIVSAKLGVDGVESIIRP